MTDAERDIVFGSLDHLEAAKSRVCVALGIAMELHESLHLGGDYYLRHLDDGSEVRVRSNIDLLDDISEIAGWPGPTFVELDIRSDGGRVAVENLLAAGLSRIARDR